MRSGLSGSGSPTRTWAENRISDSASSLTPVSRTSRTIVEARAGGWSWAWPSEASDVRKAPATSERTPRMCRWDEREARKVPRLRSKHVVLAERQVETAAQGQFGRRRTGEDP